jgi:hypothetical protein
MELLRLAAFSRSVIRWRAMRPRRRHSMIHRRFHLLPRHR